MKNLIYFIFSLGFLISSSAIAQEQNPGSSQKLTEVEFDRDTISNPYTLRIFRDGDGNLIEEIIVPGRPPKDYRAPVSPLPDPENKSANVLANVPAFSWCFGCSATSAAMIAGYYDRTGYNNMYTGPANGGIMPLNNSTWPNVVINGETRSQCPLSASRMGVDGRSEKGHVDDYWYMYGSEEDPYYGNWTQHAYGECTADYMGTNQFYNFGTSDGATRFYSYNNGNPLYDYTGCEPDERDGCHGFRLFMESRGYNVQANGNYSQRIYGYEGNTQGFTYDQFKTEIDAGRPVLIQIIGHTMVGFGYDDSGSDQLVYIHDTWDYNDHTMVWGGSYSDMQHYGVVVMMLEPLATGMLAGLVTSQDGSTPIEGATVSTGTFSASTNSSGNYTISNLPTGTYQATASHPQYITSNPETVIITQGNTSYQDFSLTPAASTISLSAPNGGEFFVAGSEAIITWETNISGNVEIEYSSNNGGSWTTISSSVSASLQTYVWTVPGINSGQCLVKISDASNLSVSDMSNNNFSIGAQNPLGGPYASDENTVLLMHFEGDYHNQSPLSGDGIPQGNGLNFVDNELEGLGKCIRFDHSSGNPYISIPHNANLSLDDDWTIETWFKATDFNNILQYFVVKPGNNDEYFSNYAMQLNPYWDNVTFSYFFTVDSRKGLTGTIPELNQWYHMAFIRDTQNDILRLIIHDSDLVELFNSQIEDTGDDPLNNVQDVLIGMDFIGMMDELRISKVARNYDDLVQANYTADVNYGEAPLEVTFSDLSTGNPTTWEWDFDNSGTIDSQVQDPVWTYTEPGTYSVKLTVSDGTNSDFEIKTNYITVTGGNALNPPVNLEVDNLGLASWDEPEIGSQEIISHHNGYSGGGIGTNSAASWVCAARFATDDLDAYYGSMLNEVNIHIYEDLFSYVELRVYKGGSLGNAGTLIYSQDITENVLINNWTTIGLSSPIILEEGNEYWIGYYIDATGGHPSSKDFGPAITEKGDWMYFNGSWIEISTEFGLDYNWCIEGVVSSVKDAGHKKFTHKQIQSHPPHEMISAGTPHASKVIHPVHQRPVNNQRDLLGYNVYLDGSLVNNTTNLYYQFTGLNPGQNYTAGVSAVYDEGESDIITGQFTYPVAGDTIYVKKDGSGNATTIQGGIDLAQNGQVVLVYPGTYTENITFSGKLITVGSLFLTTQDEAHISQTIIDGGENGSVVTIDDGETADAMLTGFTITNGSAGSGGGILVNNTSPVLSHLWILNNTAASYGGGFQHYGNNTPQMSYCLFSGNYSNTGGAIAVNDCESISFDHLTIADNTANYGAALMFTNAGINISNSILWNNQPMQVYFNYYYDPNYLEVNYCDAEGGQTAIEQYASNGSLLWGTGNLDANPMFTNATVGDYSLAPASPCIDAGDPAAPLDPDGTRADMGAFYYIEQINLNAEFSADVTSGDAPLTVQFSDESTGDPTSWAWDFENDGTVDSYLQNPEFIYTEPGLYSVKLTVSDSKGSDTETKPNYITVYEAVNAAFTADITNGSSPLTVQFTDQSGGIITSWAWDFENDGTIDSFDQNPEWTYDAIGDYTVSLTVSGSAGSDTETKTNYITVTEPLDAEFSADVTSGDSPLTVQFTDESTGDPSSWEWDFQNDGTIDSYLQNPEFTYTEPGVYTVSLTVSDSKGSDTETKTDYITVLDGSGSIDDVTASQRTDGSKTVDITYNLSGSQTSYPVILEVSFNDGSTYEEVTEVSGDVGTVEPGTGLQITWDSGTEFPTGFYYETVKMRVTAIDDGWECGDLLTDSRDGQQYETVQVGDQCWMSENISYLPEVSPSSENSTTDPLFYVYEYQGTNVVEAKATENYQNYGVLYNWPASLIACPTDDGWHLPADSEWATLIEYLGGTGVAGGKMKSTRTEPYTHPRWNSPNAGATNSSNFSGFPGGNRNTNGNFLEMGNLGYFWSSLEGAPEYAWNQYLYYNNDNITRSYNSKNYGLSVRCLKDQSKAGHNSEKGNSESDFSGESPAFTMDTKNPELTLSSPNGGDVYSYLDLLNITWAATDDTFEAEPISAGISTDEGGAVTWLASNIANSGTTQVDPPDMVTLFAKAHVNAVDAFGNEGNDASDDYFELVETIIPLEAEFSADINSGAVPLTVQFTDLSTGGATSWEWDFENDGTIDANEQNPEWTYDELGSYSVSLTVGDGTSSNTETKNDYITLLEPPQISVTPDSLDFIVNTTNGYQQEKTLTISNTGGSVLEIELYTNETVTDIDGNEYQTVRIGDQLWMAENLKVTHYRNGDPIPNITEGAAWEDLTSGAYCVYANNSAYADTFGNLYNWFAVNDGRGLAPEGWHVPTDYEIKLLEMELGMSEEEANSSGPRGTDEGCKIAGGLDLWESGDLRSNLQFGTSGFDLLPGGYRYIMFGYGTFGYTGYEAHIWSSTSSSGNNAGYRGINYNSKVIQRSGNSKQSGYSVRCVKDDDKIGLQQYDGKTSQFRYEWLTLSPAVLTIEPGASENITVTVDTETLELGEYSDMIQINSNDPENSAVHVPVTLIVTDTDLIADFSTDVTSGPAPLTVQFSDQTIGSPSTWEWNFDNDGTIDSYLEDPEYTYNEPGVYTVSLTVYDSKGSFTETKIDYITVLNATGSITDVTASQRTDGSKMVDINYNLSGSQTSYPIILEVSFNDGSTYEEVSQVSGDIGTVVPGTGLQITWDAGAEFPAGFYYETVKMRVTAIGEDWQCGDLLLDGRDGNQYETVQIGDQCFMAENLAYLPSVSPSANGSSTDPYFYVYGYQGSDVNEAKTNANYGMYGSLYNWPASLNVCPSGWHLPSNDEYVVLTDYLGGWDIAGGKMKSTRTAPDPPPSWRAPNTGATNSSGFTAFAGGYRTNSGSFGPQNLIGYFWTLSSYNTTKGWDLYLYYGDTKAYHDDNYKENGYAVRCLQNQDRTKPKSHQIQRNNFSGESASFTMDTKNPEVTLSTPNGGGLYSYLELLDITWTATDDTFEAEPISAGISTEEGGTITWLAENIANSGITQVDPPDVATLFAKAHVNAVDAFGNEGNDASDDYFELIETITTLAAEFSANVTEGDAPLTVQFTDESTGDPSSWEWDFENDGTIDSYLQNPEFTYTDPGVYTVSLTVSDSKGSDTETKTDYITVLDGTGSVSGVTAMQRTDGSKLVDITYDLMGPESSYTAILEVSFDSGENYEQVDEVTGAVGTVIPADDLLITWDAGTEFPEGFFSETMRIRVSAIGTEWTCGDILTDPRDGQSYETVQIGDQCWMAENLNTGERINGVEDMTNNGTLEKYCYDDDPANCETYGGLYQWAEMMQYTTTVGVQGICPEGWHVSTDDEWKILEGAVDSQYPVGDPMWDNTGWRGLDAGGNLKVTGTALWNSPNTGATNSSGFTALPGGYCNSSGSFGYLGIYANFWTSDVAGSKKSTRGLGNGYALVYRSSEYNTFGFSVRCLKDLPNLPPQQPSNPVPEDGSENQSIGTWLSWTCTDPETDPLTFDVYFGTTSDPSQVATGQSGNTYDPGTLDYSTEYFWKIVAHDDHDNTSDAPVWSFTTKDETAGFTCGDPLIDPRDGQAYQTVLIGNQCWMAENLNIGQRIDGAENMTDNGILEKYCQGDDPANCDTYGGLYQWYEMMQYTTSAGTQGICPEGWYLPTDDEWKILEGTVDSQYPVGDPVWDGIDIRGFDAGLNLKSSSGWGGNGNGTDLYGFGALPGGDRISSGSFQYSGYRGIWWSSTEGSGTYAWYRILYYDNNGSYRYNYYKTYGFSVRCIRDTSNLPPQQPSNPVPEDGSESQPIETGLSWTCTDPETDPLTFDVYFGTSSNPPQVVTGQIIQNNFYAIRK